MTQQPTAGKVLTRRIRSLDGATVILKYHRHQAARMRSFVASLRVKGDKLLPMAAIARRAMDVYLDRLERARELHPEVFAEEIAELERMVTPVPKPAKVSRKASSQ